MAHLSLSSASRVADRPSLLLQPKPELPEFTANWGSKQTIAQLRASIAVGGVNLEAMLQRIVEAARLFTDANGAAIALQQDKWIVCRARAGEMAPDLNSRLNSSSGISGECLRSGEALCCHDTSADSRVDAEACRRLGLRSLAVAPIGEKPNVRGILEAFSAQPEAFGDTEVSLLNELAELVTAAQQGGKPAALRARVREKLAGAALSFSKYKFVVAGLVVLAFVVWLGLRKRPEYSNLAGATGAQPLKLQSSPAVVDSSRQAMEPERSPVADANIKTKPPAGVVMASKTAKFSASENVLAQPATGSASNADTLPLNVPPPHAQPAKLPTDESVPVPPPVAIVSSSSNKAIAGLLSDSIVFPQPSTVKLSQGLSGGTLEQKVNPIYPREALMQGRQGRVTLDGVIAEDGRLQGLKVVNGDPLLARAAVQAVSQWRFQPYRLNGEPIRRATTITLIFKLP